MELSAYLPFWDKLTDGQRALLASSVQERRFAKGELVHSGAENCVGFLLVTQGQLRVYTLSEEGREITLYRLFDRDMCLFSASCMLRGIEFHVCVEAERDTAVLHIPPEVYRQLMDQSLPVSAYTNELMASHFSDIMWLMDQVLNKKLDSRLAALLLEEAELAGTDALRITHERLANHLGSVREVVSRMLKYFEGEGLVKLTRGGVELLDRPRLKALSAGSQR